MITNANGMKIRTMASTATSIRAISRWSRIALQIAPPKITIVRTAPAVRKTSSGTRIRSALPGRVRRSQVRAMALMPRYRERSLVDAAHHRIQRRHDRHRVGQQVAREERAHGAQVDEARVVDLQPERLVGA